MSKKIYYKILASQHVEFLTFPRVVANIYAMGVEDMGFVAKDVVASLARHIGRWKGAPRRQSVKRKRLVQTKV